MGLSSSCRVANAPYGQQESTPPTVMNDQESEYSQSARINTVPNHFELCHDFGRSYEYCTSDKWAPSHFKINNNTEKMDCVRVELTE